MIFTLSLPSIRFASWRWMATVPAAILTLIVTALALGLSGNSQQLPTPAPAGVSATAPPPGNTVAYLDRLAASKPDKVLEVVVQLRPDAGAKAGALVHSFGGVVTRDLHIINGVGARLTAADGAALARHPAVWAVSPNSRVEPKADDLVASALATSYNHSIRADKLWSLTPRATGRGVTVAVIDTGIAGDLPDFKVAEDDPRSRVIASAVVNPDATTAGDRYGHGTHVAGLIAGNGGNRPDGDPLDGRYAGVAPNARLVSVKASDDQGNSSVIDVIDGLQFVVDKKDDLGIRVVNLSLNSSHAESYKTDPLDAAVEQAWFSGILVVAAAGNRGSEPDAVNYAPANDPFALVVGAIDDNGTKDLTDDALATWSSRGTTQDGFSKPDVLAPGARLVSTLAPGSEYASLCPSCVVDGEYFRVGGTSMASAVVAGLAADLIQIHPYWAPRRIRSALANRMRDVPGAGGEVSADRANVSDDVQFTNPHAGITPNVLIDPATGQIDFSRASWSRASWSDAVDPLRASWSRASWSRASWSSREFSSIDECVEAARASWSRASWSTSEWTQADTDGATAQCADWSRASWSRASWSRASWSRASWSRASWSTSFSK